MESLQAAWGALFNIPASVREGKHRERVFCVGRTALAGCSLVILRLDSRIAGSHDQAALLLACLYLIYSIAAGFFTWTQPGLRGGAGLLIAGDVAWPALLVMFTGGPNSPFCILFAIPVLGAAFLCGQEATYTAAFAGALILVAEAAFVTWHWAARFDLIRGAYRFDDFALQIITLLVLGVVLGHFVDHEGQRRGEACATASMVRLADPAACLTETIEAVLSSAAMIFKAERVALALDVAGASNGWLWSSAPRPDRDARMSFSLDALESAEKACYFFPMPGASWYLRSGRGAAPYFMVALDRGGRAIDAGACALPAGAFSPVPFRSMAAVRIAVGDWSGRLLLFDFRRSFRAPQDLRFLQELADVSALAVHGIYLRRRSRARARAVERARVARDLHDGAIQSLIALELRVELMRRQTSSASAEAGQALETVRNALRDEVVNLRELMQELQRDDLAPQQLAPHLAGMVDKFQRETGIRATFTPHADSRSFSPRVTREVSRIVYEALTNARKHSGARTVRVDLEVEDARPKLVIEDDGKGFAFTGRWSQADLDAAGKGPQVIKERVRGIGGEMAIISRPNCGSRLEIRFAADGHG